MRQIIVGLADKLFGEGLTAGNTIDNIAAMDVGSITLVRTSNGVVSVDAGTGQAIFASALLEGERLHFVANVGGKFVNSNHINPNTFKWFSTVYAAAVAKIMTVGGTGTSTLPAVADIGDYLGGYLSLSVIDLSKALYDNTRYHNYEVRIKVGDTIVSLVTALVAKINNDSKAIVTAVFTTQTAGNETITLTGKTAGVNYEVIPSDIMEDMPVAATTAHVRGTGLGADVVEMEKDFATHLGYNAQSIVKDALYSEGFKADPAVNYTVFVMTWSAYDDSLLGSVDRKPEQLLVVAVNQAHANIISGLGQVGNAIIAKAAVNFT